MLAIGEIDEKYVKEAEEKRMKSPIVKIAVCFALVFALSLYMFLPYATPTSDLSAYSGSDYFPLIEGIEDYRLSFLQPKYNNNFETLMGALGNFKLGIGGDFMAPSDSPNGGADMAPGASEGNGEYVESTDNQVDGVIESDLFKMTDKYIFRIGYNLSFDKHVLRVYSIAKEESSLVSEYAIPTFEEEFIKTYLDGEMFLSEDGNTVTIVKTYIDDNTNMSKLGVISLDVSDVRNIKTRAMVSIDGYLNTSRMVDGKLLMVSEYVFNRNGVDYNDPATFVPSINRGEGDEPILFEDIIFPDTVGNTRYSVVSLLDAENLELLGANALLNFTNQVYISEKHVFISREYTETKPYNEKYQEHEAMTDIAVLGYSGDSLENKGVITVSGSLEDQYSFDERDGYLRLISSINKTGFVENENGIQSERSRNVSLYIFDLTDNSLAYSLESFAIEGEEATAVRFDGDTVYVCTAVRVDFTDPVYFIDLSDYENITSADTGIIEGYSEHLINLGDGFLLGIGEENRQYSKVEVYEQQGGEVVSVDSFEFNGNYSLDYKAYLVNRELDLFGFAVDRYYTYDEQTGKEEYCTDAYLLLRFDGYKLSYTLIDLEGMGSGADSTRAAYVDGYLYITTPTGFKVEKIQ